MKFKKFVIVLAIVSVVMGLITWLLRTSIPQWITPLWLPLLAFLALVNGSVFAFVMRARQRDPKKFATFFMGTTVVKLVIYFVVILAVAFSNVAMAKPFLITFLIYYIVFTFLETVAVTRPINK